MKFPGSIAVLILATFGSPAQIPNKLLLEADELFDAHKFGTAFSIYSELLKKDPLNANLNYKVGTCYLNSRSLKSKAEPFLERAIEFTPALTNKSEPKISDAPFLTYKLLGDAYSFNYKFDQAISVYEKYKSLLPERNINDPNEVNIVNRKIEVCKFGKELTELISAPVKIKTNKKGKTTDASFRSGSSPVPMNKSKILTSGTPSNKLQKINDAAYFVETIIRPDTAKTEDSKKIPYSPTPDTIIYVTTIGASVDGQIVLTYKNERGDGNLYISRLKNDQWSSPLRINKSINTLGWEPNECLSSDGNTLYFVSDRPGGYGGKDIYRCKKNSENEWSKAVNLGPLINSVYDDEAPFIHPDGTTLYFSSNRNKPKQCFENFMASVSGNDISGKPVVVGYPADKNSETTFYEVAAEKINSPAPKITNQKKLKQVQTDSVKDASNHDDNFLITFIDQKKSPFTLLKGQASHTENKTSGRVCITVTDNETGIVYGTYNTDPKTGLYSFLLTSGNNLNVTYHSPNHLFQSENKLLDKETEYFEKYKQIILPPISKNSKTVLNNLFFEELNEMPLKTSQTELQNIYELLNSNPKISIKLTNSIFIKTEKKFFKKLSKLRANTVKEILISKGINRERISAYGYRRAKAKKTDGLSKDIKLPYQQMELEITEPK